MTSLNELPLDEDPRFANYFEHFQAAQQWQRVHRIVGENIIHRLRHQRVAQHSQICEKLKNLNVEGTSATASANETLNEDEEEMEAEEVGGDQEQEQFEEGNEVADEEGWDEQEDELWNEQDGEVWTAEVGGNSTAEDEGLYGEEEAEMPEGEIPEGDDQDEEISEEMAEFMRQTAEHRLKRDAERLKNQKNASNPEWFNEEEYISADQIGVEGVRRRTTAQPNVAAMQEERRNELRRLYGSAAEKIAAMETVLDMRFEQHFDRTGAQLWPNIPLNL